MNVVNPIIITDAMLTSSTVVETSPAAYAGGTTYALNDTVGVAGAAGLITVYRSLQAGIGHAPASSPDWWVSIGTTYQVYSGAATYALGDKVISPTTHQVYENLVAGNIGQALSNTLKWMGSTYETVVPTNKWAMFDYLRNTSTTAPLSLTTVLTPGQRITSLGAKGLTGATAIAISMTSGGLPVYNYVEDLSTREVLDWSEYFFEPFSTRESVVLFDLPPYTDGITTVVLSAPTGDVSCEALVIGPFTYIGDVDYSAESDALNFSTILRDDFGNARLVPKRTVPKTNQTLAVDKSLVNRVRRLRSELNAIPALWAGLADSTDGYADSLLILGIYKKFSINIDFPDKAKISLELENI